MAGLLGSITDAVGLTDSGAAEKSMKKAAGLTKEQMKRLDAIDLPDEEKMKLLLENPELVGLLDAENIEDSKMGEISLDPQLRENQMKALQSLTDQSEQGLTASDKYSMEQLLGDVASADKSRQAGIEAEMARRGMDSSGAALMAKMQGGQDSANAGREKAMQMAAQGQQNKMAALSQLGNMSGNMQNADFQRQSSQASAQDAIARANAMNRQNVSGQNLAARQNIENQRANISNQQQTYNKGLEQQQFQNKLQKAGAQGAAGSNLANMYSNQAGAQAGADASTLGTIAGVGSAFLGAPAGSVAGKMMAEDGGVVHAQDGYLIGQASGGVPTAQEQKAIENKQHEAFKKKYMKRVQDEVMEDHDAKKKFEKNSEGGVPKASQAAENGAIMKGGVPTVEPGTEYMSDGSGDIIDSGAESFAGDRVDAKVNDGEAVINVPQQQRLMDLIRGKISVDELGNDDIIEGVPREYRDDLHEKIEDESDDSQMEGIRALLEMLGEK